MIRNMQEKCCFFSLIKTTNFSNFGFLLTTYLNQFTDNASVTEKEREREKEKESEREREREKEKESERERESD